MVTILAGVCMVVSPGDHAELRPCSDDRFISVRFAHGQTLDRLIYVHEIHIALVRFWTS